MDEPEVRKSPRLEVAVEVRLTGLQDDGLEIVGEATGLSVNGMGFRTSDPRMEAAPLKKLMRQAFRADFQIEGVEFSEIVCKILRVERSRRDPTKFYFVAVKFIQISDLDELNLQSYIRFFASDRDFRGET